MRQTLASPSWSESKKLTVANEIFGSSSCCTKAAAKDVARAQFKPSSAVLHRWEPPVPPGEHSSCTQPFHCGTESAWHGHSQTQASSALAASPRPSRETLLPTQRPRPWRRDGCEDHFPWSQRHPGVLGGNQVLPWADAVRGSSTSLGGWGKLTALVLSCSTV